MAVTVFTLLTSNFMFELSDWICRVSVPDRRGFVPDRRLTGRMDGWFDICLFWPTVDEEMVDLMCLCVRLG